MPYTWTSPSKIRLPPCMLELQVANSEFICQPPCELSEGQVSDRPTCWQPPRTTIGTEMQLWLIVRPALSALVRFFHISLIEARSERQSSHLGILWSPLSTLIFTGMLALVFHHPEHDRAKFYLYVLAGYVLWGFISTSITASTSVIQRRFDFAIHNNLTLIGLFCKLLIDRLFALALDIVLLFLAVLILAPASFGPNVALLPLLIILLALVSLAVAYIVNLAVIIFPDLDAIFNVGVRFMFFASPIFWGIEDAGSGVRALLVSYNPAAYFLSVFRQVFGITPFMASSWIVTIGIAAGLCLAGLLAYKRSETFVRNLK